MPSEAAAIRSAYWSTRDAIADAADMAARRDWLAATGNIVRRPGVIGRSAF